MSLAAKMGSVNTLVRVDGGYKGYNTDMTGLYRAMSSDGVSIQGEQVNCSFGAGGVGRAVASCAAKGAAHVWLLNRTERRQTRWKRSQPLTEGRSCVEALCHVRL